MISVLDYGSIPVARDSIGSWPIRNSSTAAHDGFTIFVCAGIVDTIHLICKIGNILQFLVWCSRNQSDCLQLVILFDGPSLVFDDAHVCGCVHRLIYRLFSMGFILAASTTGILLNKVRHFWTLKLHLTLVFGQLITGTSVHAHTVISIGRVRSTNLLNFGGWNLLFLSWNWRALTRVLECSTPWIQIVLTYCVGINASTSRRTSKLRPNITIHRSQALKIGGGCAPSSWSHGAIRLYLLEVSTSLVRLRLMNKFRTFGWVAASTWVINSVEILTVCDIWIAMGLHAKIQNLRAGVLLDCLEGCLVVIVILLVTIFWVGFGAVYATIDLKHILLFHIIRWHLRAWLRSATAFDGTLGCVIITSILLHIHIVHRAHTSDWIVTIAELVLILQHHFLLI